MWSSQFRDFAIGISILMVGSGSLIAQPTPSQPPREGVLKATTPEDLEKAYKKLFRAVGRMGFAELKKDTDLGIALQAAWESHKKIVRNSKLEPARADDVYDPDELRTFVKFLKERSKAPVPVWWAKDLVYAEVIPGESHSFPEETWPDFKEGKAGGLVPEGADLIDKGDTLIYTVGKQTIEFSRDTFGLKRDISRLAAFTGAGGEKWAAIATYSPLGGAPFTVAGFKSQGGKPICKAKVWAVNRKHLIGTLPHRAELVIADDTVFIFGQETCGMYLEAFEAATGKCRFRFCTSYWGNFSEKWDLK